MHSLQLIEPHSSELVHLGFRRYAPHPHLRYWIANYWTAQQYQVPASGFSETLYPDGGVGLIFSFNNGSPELELKARQITSKLLIRKSIDSIGVRFHPGGLFKLLSMDMRTISDTGDNPECLGGELNNIHEKLVELTSPSERLIKIERWLLDKCYQRSPTPGLIQHFVPQFLASDVTVENFLKNQSISRRQLERKFQQEIGLSPAQLKQLHKIKKARQRISLDPSLPLTEVALDCGFYDQSHFIHHFQKITGQTPGEYKSRKLVKYISSH